MAEAVEPGCQGEVILPTVPPASRRFWAALSGAGQSDRQGRQVFVARHLTALLQ